MAATIPRHTCQRVNLRVASMTAENLVNTFILLTAAVLAWAFWRSAQPRPVFSIRLVDGKPETRHGVVTAALLDRVREVAAAGGVSTGTVDGFAHGRFIRLRFSKEFTEPNRQQLRNWWATFGWGLPRTCEGGRCR
jgi:hypothetical protein